MKTLKFKPHLVKEILEGRKTVTWRLFDDKNLQAGDLLEFFVSESGEKFAEAKITKIREKKFSQLKKTDHKRHGEMFSGPKEMLQHYRRYYGDKVTMNTPVKMIDFIISRDMK